MTCRSHLLKGFTFFLLLQSSFLVSAQMGLKNRATIHKKSFFIFPSVLDSNHIHQERTLLLREKRNNMENTIKEHIRRSRDRDQKAQLLLRLGSLYIEDYYSELAEMNLKGNQTTSKDPHLKKAKQYLTKALFIYENMIEKFPKLQSRDEILYFLSIIYLDRNKRDIALKFLKEISKKYPRSRFIHDVHIQLGDYYFNLSQSDKAEPYYSQIIKSGYRPLLSYAVYRKAWCSYNLGRKSEALENFKWIIRSEDRINGEHSLKLTDEVLKDITLVFVDLKKLKESVLFFRGFDAKKYRSGLETMASLYSEKGDYEHSISLWTLLIGLDPNATINPDYEHHIVDSLVLKGNPKSALQYLFRVLPKYQDSSPWTQANQNNKSLIEKTWKDFETVATKHALKLHQDAQKTKNKEQYLTAQRVYLNTLKFFPQSREGSKIRYYLAEILYRHENYLMASEYFGQAYEDKKFSMRKMALFQGISALSEKLNQDRKNKGLEQLSSKSKMVRVRLGDTETPYSPFEKRFIELSKEYSEAYPKDKETIDILYERALLHYVHRDFASAIPSFMTLVDPHFHPSLSFSAAHLVLNMLHQKKDFLELEKACKYFLSVRSLSKSEFKKEVYDILHRTVLTMIQEREDKGEYQLAARQYLDYSRVYGKQNEELYEKALFNASVNFEKANLLMDAVATKEKILRRFPKTKLKEKLILQIAKQYESFGNLEKSASSYETFFNAYPKHSQSAGALRLAGIYYWGSGQFTKAEKIMKQYLKLNLPRSSQVKADLIDMYGSTRAMTKLISFHDKLSADERLPIDKFHHLIKASELRSNSGARIHGSSLRKLTSFAEKHRSELSKNKRGRILLAKVMFWETEKKGMEFLGIKLTPPQKKMEKNLKLKIALLKEIERSYRKVASMGDVELGALALFQIASNYHTLAIDILNAPVPTELPAQALDQYRLDIQRTMIKPFDEKALNMASDCIDRAQELHLMSSVIPKCYSLASAIDSKNYSLIRTLYLPPLQTALVVPEDDKVNFIESNEWPYPYFSSDLFTLSNLMRVPTAIQGRGSLQEELASISDSPHITPMFTNYKLLSQDRKKLLSEILKSSKKEDSYRYSFRYLSLLRFEDPQSASQMILEAIQLNPSQTSLHNLLALSYLEAGKLHAAKVTWLSMLARGFKNSAVLNNLAVLGAIEGRENEAILDLLEASKNDPSPEVFSNLGFLALKYRNGSLAKMYLEKAMEGNSTSLSTQVAIINAKLQSREFELVKEDLTKLLSEAPKDPYVRLTSSYFYLDYEKNSEAAKKILAEYEDVFEEAEGDLNFRKAFQATNQYKGEGELPTVNQ